MSNFGSHLPIMPDERLALTLRYIATGESFQSLDFQFRTSLMLSRISSRDAAMLWLMNWFQCLLKHLHLSKKGLKFPKSSK